MASPFGCVLVVIHNCVLCRITYISSCFLFTLPEHAHIRSRLRLNIPGDSSFHINKIVNINAFTNIYISMQYAYTRTSCVVSSADNLFVLFTLNALPELLPWCTKHTKHFCSGCNAWTEHYSTAYSLHIGKRPNRYVFHISRLSVVSSSFLICIFHS